MEEQLSDAYAEVARLKEENDKLTSRTSILEKVLALRDDQLQQASRGQVHLSPKLSLHSPPPVNYPNPNQNDDLVQRQNTTISTPILQVTRPSI